MRKSRCFKVCNRVIKKKRHRAELQVVLSVEGESGRRQAATPLPDELEDVLTLWTVSGLWGGGGEKHKQQPIRKHT